MVAQIAALAMALLLVASTAVAGQGRPAQGRDRPASGQDRPTKWWADEQMRRELGLTDVQTAKAEETFKASLPRLRELWKELDAREAELSAMIRENKADEGLIASKIDAVEGVRAEMSKTRTLMLYRIHRLLTPEQQEKLKAIHERERARRKSGDYRR